MNFHEVSLALSHFADRFAADGTSTAGMDIDEAIMVASHEQRLLFVNAMLEACLRAKASELADPVVRGALWAAVDPSATLLPYSLFSEEVSPSLRSMVLRRMQSIFETIFARRCDPVLVHGPASMISPWNQVCFMWWDVLPRHGVPYAPHLAQFDEDIIQTMGRLLQLNNVACKEAALHGLALWHAGLPTAVETVIDLYDAFIPPSLSDYKLAARSGCLQ